MIHKYYYETIRYWYLCSWPEECDSCGELSDKVMCPKCRNVKEVQEEKVTDKSLLRDLNTFNQEVIERHEKRIEQE